jgi:hypothetical protein
MATVDRFACCVQGLVRLTPPLLTARLAPDLCPRRWPDRDQATVDGWLSRRHTYWRARCEPRYCRRAQPELQRRRITPRTPTSPELTCPCRCDLVRDSDRRPISLVTRRERRSAAAHREDDHDRRFARNDSDSIDSTPAAFCALVCRRGRHVSGVVRVAGWLLSIGLGAIAVARTRGARCSRSGSWRRCGRR